MFLIAFAAFGAVVASFTGVLAERAYTGEGWAASRSRCNSCARSLDARDLVPVLSWIFSRGRCRSCKSPVPWLYAASEAALGLSFALAYLRFGLSFALASFLLALAILAFIVLYDLRHTLVPPLASSAWAQPLPLPIGA